jgi:hypothetical protein
MEPSTTNQVNLVEMIQRKLAVRRYKNLADVIDLIRSHDLSESYLTNLHPSFHRDFLECLEGKRREDKHEAFQDAEFERLGYGHTDSTNGENGEPNPPAG